MRRLPVTFRALMLVPLFAAGVDQLRVVAFCSSGAQSCLEAAGGGLIGPLGLVVLGVYAVILSLAVGRLVRADRRAPSFVRLWLTSSGGLLAVCGGHAALAAALGQGTTGGGWLQLLPLILAAAALLALALRAAPAALRLLRGLRPRAPRPRALALPARRRCLRAACAFSRTAALTAAGRAPPLPIG